MESRIHGNTSHQEPAGSAESPYRSADFHVKCPALHLFVLVRAKPGKTHTLAEMEPAGADEWRVSLSLPPGAYRYRYYADFGGVTTYVSPADVEVRPVRMRRFDAILDVGLPALRHARGADALTDRGAGRLLSATRFGDRN